MLDFFLLCILFVVVVVSFLFFLLCNFVFFLFLETCQKISENMEIAKTAKMKNAEKKNGHFDKSS